MKKKLNYAKNKLIVGYPFYANLLLNSPLEPREDIPTAATDGKRIFYNPKFFEDLTAQEVMTVLCHEVLHKVFLHSARLNKRDPKLWNIACDYVINPIIKAEGLVSLKDWLYESKYENLTADEVYEDLKKNPPPTGGDGVSAPDHLLPNDDLDESKQKQLEEEVKQQVAAAKALAEQMGDLPAGLKKLIDKMLNPKVDWKEVLRNTITRSLQGHEQQTWRKLNRRFVAQDIYLPSYEGTKAPPLIVMFDTSGSIYAHKELTDQFIAEIKAIAEDTQPEAVHVICTDTKVHSHDIFEIGDDINFELKGGGGTDFENFFNYIQKQDLDASTIIAMTDLYAGGIPKDYPIETIWCVYGNPDPKPPFGQTIQLGDN